LAAGVSIVNAAATIVAFVVTTASLYYVSRQQATERMYQKGLFICSYLTFDALFFLGLLRNFPDPQILQAYGIIAPSCVLWGVVLLTFTAYTIYAKPQGRSTVDRMRSIYWRWPHGPILVGFVIFILVTDAYVVYYRPFSIVQLTSVDGVLVGFPAYNSTFLDVSLFVLAFFAYPTALLLSEARRTKVASTRRTLTIFPLCWIGIGGSLLFFQGYLVTQGYDFVGVSYVIISIFFGVTALIFRRTSVLSSFYDPMVFDLSPAPAAAETKAVDMFGPTLLMVDPSTSFERTLADVARRKVSAGNLVYVFTSKESPVHHALSTTPGTRFYLMTGNVSYASPSSSSNELLVPQEDTSVILDLLDKTISAARKAPITIIFDSISDLVLYLGPEGTYKFLKQARQIAPPPNLTSIYLLTVGAQDERTLNLVKSLFRLHALLDADGLRMIKGGTAHEETEPREGE
jgi:hypothetical protein